jgi:MFS family permease
MLAALKVIDNNHIVLIMFYVVSLLMGVGYGLIFPAYNTLFVNLAPNNRRATASSTYMTSWDIGIGLGLISGGWLADSGGGLSLAYLAGGFIAGISCLFFAKIAGPHFNRNKLR